MAARSKYSPSKVQQQMCENQAVELRAARASYDQIARTVEWRDNKGEVHKAYSNRGAAWKAVQRALKERPAENVEHLRAIEGHHLDMLTNRCMQILVRPGLDDDTFLKTMDRLIRLSERRAKHYGSDAAEKYELTGAAGGPIETEITVIARLQERLDDLRRLKQGDLSELRALPGPTERAPGA